MIKRIDDGEKKEPLTSDHVISLLIMISYYYCYYQENQTLSCVTDNKLCTFYMEKKDRAEIIHIQFYVEWKLRLFDEE